MRQHKHLSLLGLWVENCLGRVLAQLGLMAALEIIVFGARLYLLPERPMEEVLKGVPSLFMAGWIALFHLLAHCGDERRAVGCTLRRLRVPEGAALAWKGLFGAACFLLLWAVQAAVCLGMGLWYAAAVGPAYRSAQTVLLAFYRVPFLHSLLPLAETAGYLRNLLFAAAMGLETGLCSWRMRRGSRALFGRAMAVAAAFLFSQGMGGLTGSLWLGLGAAALAGLDALLALTYGEEGME